MAAANARPQDDIAGYNYEVPENPLTINRPEEPIEAASDLAAEAQESHDEGSHGGGGHGGGGHGGGIHGGGGHGGGHYNSGSIQFMNQFVIVSTLLFSLFLMK